MDENFTVELISNVKTAPDIQRKNSIGNFVSVLSRKLIFTDDWEVALTEISYTKSWYNIFENQTIWLVDSFNNKYICEEQIEKGNYEIVELISKINDIYINFTIKNQLFVNCPILIYNRQTNKIAIRLGESNIPVNTLVFPYFDEFLANLLGLVDHEFKQYPQTENFQFITKFEEIVKYEDMNYSNRSESESRYDSHTNSVPIVSINSAPEIERKVPSHDLQKPDEKDAALEQGINSNSPIPKSEIKDTKNQTDIQTAPQKSTQPVIIPSSSSKTNNQEPLIVKTTQITPTTTTVVVTTTQNTKTSTKTTSTKPSQTTSTSTITTPRLGTKNSDLLRNLQKIKNPIQEKKKDVTIKRRLPNIEDGIVLVKRSAPYTRSEIDELKKHFENIHYVEGFNSVTLYGSIKSLFVYCDIIKPNLVGDTEVPLIRRVEIPSEKKFGHQIEIIYTRPEYFPLVSHEINSIEIDIKDDGNRFVDFAFGRVYLKLHFRKKQDAKKSLYNLLF